MGSEMAAGHQQLRQLLQLLMMMHPGWGKGGAISAIALLCAPIPKPNRCYDMCGHELSSFAWVPQTIVVVADKNMVPVTANAYKVYCTDDAVLELADTAAINTYVNGMETVSAQTLVFVSACMLLELTKAIKASTQTPHVAFSRVVVEEFDAVCIPPEWRAHASHQSKVLVGSARSVKRVLEGLADGTERAQLALLAQGQAADLPGRIAFIMGMSVRVEQGEWSQTYAASSANGDINIAACDMAKKKVTLLKGVHEAAAAKGGEVERSAEEARLLQTLAATKNLPVVREPNDMDKLCVAMEHDTNHKCGVRCLTCGKTECSVCYAQYVLLGKELKCFQCNGVNLAIASDYVVGGVPTAQGLAGAFLTERAIELGDVKVKALIFTHSDSGSLNSAYMEAVKAALGNDTDVLYLHSSNNSMQAFIQRFENAAGNVVMMVNYKKPTSITTYRLVANTVILTKGAAMETALGDLCIARGRLPAAGGAAIKVVRIVDAVDVPSMDESLAARLVGVSRTAHEQLSLMSADNRAVLFKQTKIKPGYQMQEVAAVAAAPAAPAAPPMDVVELPDSDDEMPPAEGAAVGQQPVLDDDLLDQQGGEPAGEGLINGQLGGPSSSWGCAPSLGGSASLSLGGLLGGPSSSGQRGATYALARSGVRTRVALPGFGSQGGSVMLLGRSGSGPVPVTSTGMAPLGMGSRVLSSDVLRSSSGRRERVAGGSSAPGEDMLGAGAPANNTFLDGEPELMGILSGVPGGLELLDRYRRASLGDTPPRASDLLLGSDPTFDAAHLAGAGSMGGTLDWIPGVLSSPVRSSARAPAAPARGPIGKGLFPGHGGSSSVSTGGSSSGTDSGGAGATPTVCGGMGMGKGLVAAALRADGADLSGLGAAQEFHTPVRAKRELEKSSSPISPETRVPRTNIDIASGSGGQARRRMQQQLMDSLENAAGPSEQRM